MIGMTECEPGSQQCKGGLQHKANDNLCKQNTFLEQREGFFGEMGQC